MWIDYPESAWGREYQRRRLSLYDLAEIAAMRIANGASVEDHRAERRLLWDGRRVVRRERPQSLLAAAWCLFAEWQTGEGEYRRCENPGCARWIKIGRGASRAQRETCSGRCKTARSRARAKERTQ